MLLVTLIVAPRESLGRPAPPPPLPLLRSPRRRRHALGWLLCFPVSPHSCHSSSPLEPPSPAAWSRSCPGLASPLSSRPAGGSCDGARGNPRSPHGGLGGDEPGHGGLGLHRGPSYWARPERLGCWATPPRCGGTMGWLCGPALGPSAAGPRTDASPGPARRSIWPPLGFPHQPAPDLAPFASRPDSPPATPRLLLLAVDPCCCATSPPSPSAMPREWGDDAGRPKRHTDDRRDPQSSSPDGHRREADLRQQLSSRTARRSPACDTHRPSPCAGHLSPERDGRRSRSPVRRASP